MALVDMTVKITPKMITDAQGNEKKALAGHLGTHFDVMNQEFPLEYTERKGIVFDVSGRTDGDITCEDIEISLAGPAMFVAFSTGFIEREGYGNPTYFKEHPQLSQELIHELVQRNVSIIGVDFAGVRRGAEHTPADQFCADNGVFVVENLCNLGAILKGRPHAAFLAHTYPVHYADMTGLPCRVVAEV